MQGSSFDYERRYELGTQRIYQQRILSGREYQDLLDTQNDLETLKLRMLRTSFLYESQYF